MLKIIFTYWKCWFYWIFQIKSPERDAFRSLYRKHTFRVPKELHHDPLIGFRFLKKALLALKAEPLRYHNKVEALVYDGDEKQKNQRLSYLRQIINNKNLEYVSVNTLPGLNFTHRFFFLLCTFPFFFTLVVISVFSAKRASIALSVLSLSQNYLLYRMVKVKEVKTIYYFFSFENDANFNSLLMMNKGIEVINIPGPNPLQRFHQLAVSTKIALCTGFQYEQAETMKVNWYVKDILKWPLYGFQDFRQYINNRTVDYEYELGFISSGIWRRLELGLQALEDDYSSEQELIVWLKEYIALKKIPRLFVFLHPIEKKDASVYAAAIKFYSKEFPMVELAFSDISTTSYKDFNRVNLTVSSHSTTNLQRLFCGFKVLYTPMKFKQQLFPATSISNICLMNKPAFFNTLDICLPCIADDYFSRYHLWNYHFKYANVNV